MNPIIFLDIDGVLNGHQSDSQGYCGIEQENVVHLNYIIDRTNPIFVLTSSWRYLILEGAMTLKGFEYMLVTHKIQALGRLYGHTPKDDVVDADRGEQIYNWLVVKCRLHHHPLLILDDLDLGISDKFPDNFVQTDPKIGLTEKQAKHAVKLLSQSVGVLR